MQEDVPSGEKNLERFFKPNILVVLRQPKYQACWEEESLFQDVIKSIVILLYGFQTNFRSLIFNKFQKITAFFNSKYAAFWSFVCDDQQIAQPLHHLQ